MSRYLDGCDGAEAVGASGGQEGADPMEGMEATHRHATHRQLALARDGVRDVTAGERGGVGRSGRASSEPGEWSTS